MREIKFRAKAVNREGRHRTNYKNNDWVYGLLTKHKFIFDDNHNLNAEMRNEDGVEGIEVDENTLGQYTGLKDKNGVEIYEGDIVIFTKGIYEYKSTYDTYITKVEYLVQKCGISQFKPFCTSDMIECEVIGNIYDNPELLEENNNDK